jgi:hypothetical protein
MRRHTIDSSCNAAERSIEAKQSKVDLLDGDAALLLMPKALFWGYDIRTAVAAISYAAQYV